MGTLIGVLIVIGIIFLIAKAGAEQVEKAKKQVKFLHDLPAHPGEEIEEGLLYDSRSIVFDQSENRLWAQTALMDYIF